MFSKRSPSSPNRTTEKQKQTNYYTPGALQALYSNEIDRQLRPRATNEIGMMSAHTSSIF